MAISTVMLAGSFAGTTAEEIVAPKAYAEEIQIEKVLIKKKECSCVEYVRSLVPNLPRGDAKDLVPNSSVPRVGGVGIINYGGTWHLFYIYDKVSPTGLMPIQDGNYEECQETFRTIHIDDPRIVGYWSDII